MLQHSTAHPSQHPPHPHSHETIPSSPKHESRRNPKLRSLTKNHPSHPRARDKQKASSSHGPRPLHPSNPLLPLPRARGLRAFASCTVTPSAPLRRSLGVPAVPRSGRYRYRYRYVRVELQCLCLCLAARFGSVPGSTTSATSAQLAYETAVPVSGAGGLTSE